MFCIRTRFEVSLVTPTSDFVSRNSPKILWDANQNQSLWASFSSMLFLFVFDNCLLSANMIPGDKEKREIAGGDGNGSFGGRNFYEVGTIYWTSIPEISKPRGDFCI